MIIVVLLIIIICVLCITLLINIKSKSIIKVNKVKTVNDSLEVFDENIISKDKINLIKEKYRRTENIEVLTKKVSKEDVENFYKSQIDK